MAAWFDRSNLGDHLFYHSPQAIPFLPLTKANWTQAIGSAVLEVYRLYCLGALNLGPVKKLC